MSDLFARQGGIIDRAVYWALMAVLAFAPIAFGAVHVWAYSIAVMVLSLAFAMWALRWRYSQEATGIAPLMAGLFLFAAFSAFQMVPLPTGMFEAISPRAAELYRNLVPGYPEPGAWPLSVYVHYTAASLRKFIACCIVFLILTGLLKDAGRRTQLAWLIIFVGVFEASYGLVNYFSRSQELLGFKKLTGIATATGTFVNPNHFAGYLGMALMLVLGRMAAILGRSGAMGVRGFFTSREAPAIALHAVFAFLFAIGIFFSHSRAAILMSALLVAVFGAMAFIKWRGRAFVMAAALVLFAALIFAAIDTRSVLKEFSTLGGDFVSYRLVIWGAMVSMIKDFPLVGTGLGTFSLAFRHYMPEGFAHKYDYAHNDYLELVSDSGVIGALIMLFALVQYALLIARGYKACRDEGRRLEALGAIMALVYIGMFSVTDFNLQIPSNALTFAAVAAYAASALPLPAATQTGSAWPRRAVIPALAMAAVLVYASLTHLLAERAFSVERTFMSAYRMPSVTDEKQWQRLESAIRLAPGEAQYHRLAANYMSLRFAASPEEAQSMREETLREYEKATRLSPLEGMTHLNMAWYLVAQGYHDKGLKRLDDIIALEPGNAYNRVFYAETIATYASSLPEKLRPIYMLRAKDELLRAIRISPEYADNPFALNAIRKVLLDTGETERALEALSPLRKLNKDTYEFHAVRARLNVMHGDRQGGVAAFRQLITSQRLDEGQKNRVSAIIGQTLGQRPDADLEVVLLDYYLGSANWDGALSLLSKYPEGRMNPRMKMALARAYEGSGKRREAEVLYNSLVGDEKLSAAAIEGLLRVK